MSDLTEARVKAISEGLAKVVRRVVAENEVIEIDKDGNVDGLDQKAARALADAWVRQAVKALEEFSRPGILSNTARDALAVFPLPETAPEAEAQSA